MLSNTRELVEALLQGGLLNAVNAALTLRRRGGLEHGARRMLDSELEHADGTARLLALHALAPQHDESTQARILAALRSDDTGMREHAAWVLGERPPDPRALPGLIEVLDGGGYGGMLAQLTLERWGSREQGLVVGTLTEALRTTGEADRRARYAETLGLLRGRTDRGSRAAGGARRSARPGLHLAQVMLQGRLDSELTGAGAGDGGGLATLLVSLTRALDAHPDVAEVVTFTRAFVDPAMPALYRAPYERIGVRSSLERLRYGPVGYLPTSEQWPFRAQIERELLYALQRHGGLDAAHLRFADVGTFAAARVFRRLGVPIVFTLAPDPHGVLRSAEASGELSRETFAAADLEQHYLFRARLVDWMLRHADALALLPRPGGEEELRTLLGPSFDAVPRERLRTIPEGIAIREGRQRTRLRAVSGRPAPAPPDAVEALSTAVRALPPERHELPLLVTVGRLHRVKGIPLLVDAWSGDDVLSSSFNLLVVGGELECPTAEERFVLDEIDAVCRRRPRARDGLVLLGHRPNGEIPLVLEAAAEGIPGVVAPGGVYVCASVKEEFGLALLEALAAGLSAVAPDTGGPPTYIDDGRTGVLVDTTSVAALRDGLHRAAAARLDEARAARARRLVAERFTVTAMADELVSLYESTTGADEVEAA
jgi:glycosyltransferase involved in cell wall biosynthesis